MITVSIILLSLAPMFLVAALAVRFAGDRQVLNTIDYATITDKPGLHRWTGNRLLLLPLLSLVFGVVSIQRPMFGVIGGAVVVLALFLVTAWIMLGSDKFRA